MDARSQTTETASETAKESRDQSTIQFPYGDLNDAISVAKGIMSRGGVPLDPDQLAGCMGQMPNSGSFRLKVATARIFGLIETVQGKYKLTELGFAITEARREKAAKAEAFLKVPLYKKAYEEFRNKQLPPRPVALEHAFVGFGVAPKQKDKARLAFDKSAQQAGFFDQGGRERLISPLPIAGSSAPEGDESSFNSVSEPSPPGNRTQNQYKGSGNSSSGGYHPFIAGLLERLPEPDTVWSIEGRAAWLEAAASVFKLIYQGDGRISISTDR